jgi:hypothetical protein
LRSTGASKLNTPRSSLNHSREVLNQTTPTVMNTKTISSPISLPNTVNSLNGSLGASISDLSSEAISDLSDNYHESSTTTKNNQNSHSINKYSTINPVNGSRLPILKKK